MTKLTNEQIERILSKAPKKALTVDHDCKWYYLSESRSLDDLREILSLREGNEELSVENSNLRQEVERLRYALNQIAYCADSQEIVLSDINTQVRVLSDYALTKLEQNDE